MEDGYEPRGQCGAQEQNVETEKTAGSIYGFACLIGLIRFYSENQESITVSFVENGRQGSRVGTDTTRLEKYNRHGY